MHFPPAIRWVFLALLLTPLTPLLLSLLLRCATPAAIGAPKRGGQASQIRFPRLRLRSVGFRASAEGIRQYAPRCLAGTLYVLSRLISLSTVRTSRHFSSITKRAIPRVRQSFPLPLIGEKRNDNPCRTSRSLPQDLIPRATKESRAPEPIRADRKRVHPRAATQLAGNEYSMRDTRRNDFSKATRAQKVTARSRRRRTCPKIASRGQDGKHLSCVTTIDSHHRLRRRA